MACGFSLALFLRHRVQSDDLLYLILGLAMFRISRFTQPDLLCMPAWDMV